MTTTNIPRSARPGVSIASIELAVVVSLLAVALAVALSSFAGVATAPIVIGTIVAASVVGWSQPAARLHPAPVRHSQRLRH